ncbi:MAG TPA: hypothetical protein IAB66_00135 [Candidatus Caccousia avistercoris]|nr:hypothetical protein [Candidatus Caccousia avistercoris]
MMNAFMTASVLFQSVLGPVESESLWNSLKLMGLGMLGILIVMVLIWVVIAVLNKATSGHKGEK